MAVILKKYLKISLYFLPLLLIDVICWVYVFIMPNDFFTTFWLGIHLITIFIFSIYLFVFGIYKIIEKND